MERNELICTVVYRNMEVASVAAANREGEKYSLYGTTHENKGRLYLGVANQGANLPHAI
jgi:hypothetical protein